MVIGGSKIHERMAHFFIDIYSLISFLTQSKIFILSRNVDYTEFSAVSIYSKISKDRLRRVGGLFLCLEIFDFDLSFLG